MRAAIIGCVQRVDVARAHRAAVQIDDRLDRAIHRAEMHRHMRGVGDEMALRIEDGAGEIEPLLDVDRIGGVLQRDAHLFGDRHEEVVEHLQHDGIGVGAEGAHGVRAATMRVSNDMVARRDRRLPAGLDDDGLVRFDRCRAGPGEDRAARERIAAIDAGSVEGAGGEHGGASAMGTGWLRGASTAGSRIAAPPPTASTSRLSTTIALPSKTKPNCLRCASSKAAMMSSSEPGRSGL